MNGDWRFIGGTKLSHVVVVVGGSGGVRNAWDVGAGICGSDGVCSCGGGCHGSRGGSRGGGVMVV